MPLYCMFMIMINRHGHWPLVWLIIADFKHWIKFPNWQYGVHMCSHYIRAVIRANQCCLTASPYYLFALLLIAIRYFGQINFDDDKNNRWRHDDSSRNRILQHTVDRYARVSHSRQWSNYNIVHCMVSCVHCVGLYCSVFQIRCTTQRKESDTWGVAGQVHRLRWSARISCRPADERQR